MSPPIFFFSSATILGGVWHLGLNETPIQG
jgi:hypothetical protein